MYHDIQNRMEGISLRNGGKCTKRLVQRNFLTKEVPVLVHDLTFWTDTAPHLQLQVVCSMYPEGARPSSHLIGIPHFMNMSWKARVTIWCTIVKRIIKVIAFCRGFFAPSLVVRRQLRFQCFQQTVILLFCLPYAFCEHFWGCWGSI